MPSKYTRRQLLGGVAGAGLLTLPGCSGMTPFVGQRIEESETVDPNDADRLSIRGDAGNVVVVGDDRSDIEVELVKQSSSIRSNLDDLEFEIDRSNDELEFRSEWHGDEGWFQSRPSIDFDIDTPYSVSLDRIESSVGRVIVQNVSGNLDLRTSTGQIDVETVSGTVSAQTSTGRVAVRDVERIGDLRTSTGRVETEVPAIDGDTRLSTSTGRITAAISEDLDAELRATTNTGSVDVGDLELNDRTSENGFISGTLGDGGPTLEIETNTGRITLERLE